MFTFASVCVLLFSGVFGQTVHEEFLRDSKYSIQSIKDDGTLTLKDTYLDIEKIVVTEPWQNKVEQHWIVENFQSLGKYHLTPITANKSGNAITYMETKNVYSLKRQWKITLLKNEKYQIQNPESKMCLTQMGLYQEVEETYCDSRNPTNQVWKFRILRRN